VKSRLGFDLRAYDVAVPIEVYDDDLALRARTLSSGSVKLVRGRYHLVARLPDGTRLSASVDLGDQDHVAALGRPSRPRPVRRRAVSPTSDHAPGSEQLLLTGRSPSGAWKLWQSEHKSAAFPNMKSQAIELRLRCTGASEQVTVIPPPALRYLRPDVQVDQAPHLRTALRHDVADAIMGYVNRSQVLDAGLLADGVAPVSEQALWNKRDDPIAAAVGAFALLALGQLDRLHDWTANLYRWFPWLPDATVAYAEHLARAGDHDQARHVLHRLATQGVPCLTVGLTTAATRLSFYAAQADWGDLTLTTLARAMTRHAIACDLTATVTAFAADHRGMPIPRRDAE
jgi:hypothetical protein